ncbi:hypothetical protein [Hymenobacter cavernae]|uniref:Uncharacterized protein n=1 Tax=Hymenobacter cavernae TaxID=2044852 RepID=A0ABQ1UNE2_9BACT|nr:hypothetical protein [Hymenobacter cavernae]GGF20829.1 hypothetical protein GCM10011383_35640 [Hymenobacter cavernae]
MPSSSSATTAQETGPDFWQTVPAEQAQQLGKPRFAPSRYYVAALDLEGLQKALADVPVDGSSGLLLALPLPDGSRLWFRMRATTVMAPELAARYPMLRTYAGELPNQPENRVRLDLTPTGLRAMIIYEGQSLLIEPYRPGDTAHYLCFDKASLPAGSKQPFSEAGFNTN